MVKVSEWKAAVAEDWFGEPCNRCGRPMATIGVADDGIVQGYCRHCGHSQIITREYPPAELEPEGVEPDDLPW